MKKVLGLCLMLALVAGACRTEDVRTVVIKVPGLKNQACAKLIQDAFMRQPGIVSIQPDFQKKELKITYNSMVIAIKNLEYTVAGVGFDANAIVAPTNAVAALPPECK